jgi:hypothetical protein
MCEAVSSDSVVARSCVSFMIIPPALAAIAEPSIHPEQAVSTLFGALFFGRPGEACNDVIRHPSLIK